MNMKKRLLSGFLALVMTVGLVPTLSLGIEKTEIQAAENNPKVFVYEKGDLDSTGKAAIATNAVASFSTQLWHYSGGWWGNGYDDPNKVYDKDVKKTEGGVADAEESFKKNGLLYGTKDFVYNIDPNSDIAKSLDNGEDLHIEIDTASENKDVTLASLFNFPITTDSENNLVFAKNPDNSLKGYDNDGNVIDTIAKVEKNNGVWQIIFSLPIKLHFYDSDKLSFKDFNLGLDKYIPIPRLGFGYVMFSMFHRQTGQNRPANMWFAPESGVDKLGRPVDIDALRNNISLYIDEIQGNRIHPSYIKKSVWKKNGSKKEIVSSGYLESGHKITLLGDSVDILDSEDWKIGDGRTFAYAGAVGLNFLYDLKLNVYAEPKTKVVASYVKVVGLDDNYNYILEPIAPSEELEGVEVVNNRVKIEDIQEKDINGQKYNLYLNDVISSPKDIGDASSVEWTYEKDAQDKNGESVRIDTPDGNNGSITATKEDVDYYRLGLRTDSNLTTQAIVYHITEQASDPEELLGSLLSLAKSVIQEDMVTMGKSETEGPIEEAVELNVPYEVPIVPKETVSVTGSAIVEDVSVIANALASGGSTYDPEYSTEGEITTTNTLEENVVYIRYLCFPDIVQRNKVHVYEDDTWLYDYEEEEFEKEAKFESAESITVAFTDITQTLKDKFKTSDVTLNKWVTSRTSPEDLAVDPMPPADSQQGTSIPTEIMDMPKTEDIYTEWTVIKHKNTDPTAASVPQWRLSKYFDTVGEWTTAFMGLPLGGDTGHATSTIEPSGGYRYNVVNPNEQIADPGNNPTNQRVESWIHSKAITRGSYSVSHNNPSVNVDVNGTLTLIKDTANSGLTSASWIEHQAAMDGLLKYDITSGVTPNAFNKSEIYTMQNYLDYGIENIDTYTHFQGHRYHYIRYCGSENCGGHNVCRCHTLPVIIGPRYSDGNFDLTATFARYKAKADSGKFATSPVIQQTNGFTSIKYQLTDTIKVYPEYGMLFTNDSKQNSLKWIVGDQTRAISPVVYQTLQHKVYVEPFSSGSNAATDSRAITAANKLGLGKLQTFYKGSSLTNNFTIWQNEKKTSTGLLTVKTFALDFDASKNVKSAWGNEGYNSYTQHGKLLGLLKEQSANYAEQLLIDSPAYGNLDYKGGEIRGLTSGKYKMVNYNKNDNQVDNGNAVVFEHKLIVRGGQVVAVLVQDRADQTNTNKVLKTMPELKTYDNALYSAIINMNLYDEGGNRANTVFKNFEHQAGDQLTESEYSTLLNQARMGIDGFDSSSVAGVSTSTGWYSEDTTVLVVKEYVSNLTVPGTSASDKISMSVTGLETPINKNEFFSKLGKGYVSLKYDLTVPSNALYQGVDAATATFTYTSFPNDDKDFGVQKESYLVPNASITDITRLS